MKIKLCGQVRRFHTENMIICRASAARQFKYLQRLPLKTKTLVTTHIYNISETISDSSVKFWLCFLPLQDMHTRQLQKIIRVSPVWRISRWIILIQFQ